MWKVNNEGHWFTLSKYAVNLDPVWLCMNCKQEVDTITVLFTQTPSELQSSPDIHHLWHHGQFSKAIRWTQSSSCPPCVHHQVQMHGDKRISSTVYKHTANVFRAIFTRVKTDAGSIHVPYCQNKLYEKNFSKASDERWKTTFCVILFDKATSSVSKISNWPENPKNLTTGCSEFHLYQTYVFADWKFGIRISHIPKGVNVNKNYDGIKLAVRSISHTGHTSDIIVSASIVPSCAKPAEHLDAQKECRKCAQILAKPISPI